MIARDHMEGAVMLPASAKVKKKKCVVRMYIYIYIYLCVCVVCDGAWVWSDTVDTSAHNSKLTFFSQNRPETA